jgi:predicted DNA repair protein MutK
LVGGGIINHAFPFLHHFTEDAAQVTSHLPAVGSIVGAVTPTLINFVIGAIAGIIVVLIVTFGKKMFSKKA